MIPVYTPLLAGAEDEYVLNTLNALDLSGHGRAVRVFEERFADYVGVRHAVAVSSGTAALEVALHAVGVGEGDEVILPSFTIISCAVAVLRLGAVPVLVDVDPETWCIDVVGVEAAITDETKAVMPVDMMGHPAGVSGTGHLALVQDRCQSLGADFSDGEPNPDPWTECFSFYPNKLITTGEGGMVTTDDHSIAERARAYRNLGLGTGADRFRCSVLGHNFRMSGLAAALGCAQLEQIDTFLELKRAVARKYRNRLAGVDGFRFQVEQPWAKSAHWMVGVVMDGIPAGRVIDGLAEKGIESRPFFLGLHEQPCLHNRVVVSQNCEVTEELSRYGLYLPSGPGLQDSEIDQVCETFRRVIKECGNGR